MPTADPETIALQFNECINNADIQGLEELMTEDHIFIDMANNRIKGKASNIAMAWKPFFKQFPIYKNIFKNVVAKDTIVIMQGYSVCSEEILNNIRAIWVAEIIENKVGLWHIYPDTKENREMLNL